MNGKFAAIIAKLPPLPRSWSERSTHDSNPCNRKAWAKHVKQLAKAKSPDITPKKKLRVVAPSSKRTA